MRYSEEIIEQVRSANDIVAVIGQYVRLTKKGSSYFGLCPFHGEKTASFSVSPQKQIYYCFGCGAGGNVITFLMEYENYSFTEALKALAERAGITLPAPSGSGESREQSELRAKLLEINKLAAVFYYEQLKSEKGRQGYAYFREKRALSDATITHFGLGFSPKAPDALYRYLKGKGFSDALLKESGLVTIEERGARDKFWNRVIFPIMDVNNRVVGFGGRVTGDGMPKYLNSPETKIFDKSRLLYGLNFARKSRRGYLLLCEGYMDVIALHQAGFTNAVASLGTAFNEKHAQLLKRYTDQVILTQDNDEAGIRAKLRAFPILQEAGLSVRVIDTSETGYKDPDEFIKNLGAEAYETAIKKAKNAFLFEVDAAKKKYNLNDPAEATAFYRETAEKLCRFSEELERESYIKAVSREHGIAEKQLTTMVNRMLLQKMPRAAASQHYDPDEAFRKAEREKAARQREAQRREAAEDASKASADGTKSGQSEASGTSRRPSAGAVHTEGRSGRRRLTDRDSVVRKAERLLLSWGSVSPLILKAVQKELSAEAFSEGIFREIAELLFSGNAECLSPAAIMDRYPEDGEQRKQIGAIFNADASHKSLSEMSRNDLEKTLSEAVRSIKAAALSAEIEKAGNDPMKLQRLLMEKNTLNRLRISLPEE